MPISQIDLLFNLIKSLTKAEKRNFRIYAKRIQSTDTLKFIQLFDLLDKQKSADENAILNNLVGVNKAQLTNLKRHLYKQILISLRLIHIQKNSALQIRELIDYASVLYGKGLYLQSLKLLEKARKLAQKKGYDIIDLELIEFQKIIETRHITRSGVIKNQALVEEADQRISSIVDLIALSNLRLKMHDLYIRHGHIKTEDEYNLINEIFHASLPPVQEQELGFFERIYLYQSYVWYYYILLDFGRCLEFSLRWVELFKKEPYLVNWDADLLMRGYHYLLTSAFNIKDKVTFSTYLEELEKFRKSNYKRFNTNSKITSFLYVHMGRLNHHFLHGTFDLGIQDIPRTLRRISMYGKRLDSHRILVFYYKIAWMYFCNQQPDKSIKYLNKIITLEAGNLREDIQGYSRLLFIMAHIDLGNYNILEYLVSTVNTFYKKMREKNKVQVTLFNFFKKIAKKPPDTYKLLFRDLAKELKILESDPFEKRAFIYLDAGLWVESKLSGKTISELIGQRDSEENI